MGGKSKIFFLMSFFVFSLASFNLFAQDQSGPNSSSVVEDSIGDLSLIAATGLGGAILGLSTLPFKKHPTQHLRHILVGGSIGIVIGVAIVIWDKATKSQEMIGQVDQNILYNNLDDRLSWHSSIEFPKKTYLDKMDPYLPIALSYTHTF